MAIKNYMVHGDMSAEKSSDAYPVMALCDDCVGEFEVVTCEGNAEGPCENCGCDADDLGE